MKKVLAAAALLLTAHGSLVAQPCYSGPRAMKAFALEPGRMVSSVSYQLSEAGKTRTVREDIRFSGKSGNRYTFLVITTTNLPGHTPLSMDKVTLAYEGRPLTIGRHTELRFTLDVPEWGHTILRASGHSNLYASCSA